MKLTIEFILIEPVLVEAAAFLQYTSVDKELPKGMANKSKIEKKRKTIAKRKQKIQKLLKQKEKLDQELLKVEEDNRYDMDAIALRDSDDELLGELANIQEEIDKIKERDRMDKPEEHGETK